MVQNGHRVKMVCGSYTNGKTGLSHAFVNGCREGIVDGIDVLEFDLSYGNKDSFVKRSLVFFRFALRSITVAMREPADVVFATTTPLTAGIPGIFAKWLRRKPFVFEVRDLWPELPRAMGVITNPMVLWAMGALEWVSYKSADRLIGLSPGIVDGIARLNIPRERIALVPNGCDLALFEGATSWRPDAISDSDFLAVFTGTHGAANGLESVIDAAAVLKRKRVRNIKMLLVGDGKQKSALIARVDRERLGDYVVFHDSVPKTKLAGLMAGADVGMQLLADVPAFYYGTSPNKFFDYLSAGLPVITNYPGWVADLVVENGCGLAVPPQDPEAFANGLLQLSTSQLGAMGAAGLALAKREFDRKLLGDIWKEQIERALP